MKCLPRLLRGPLETAGATPQATLDRYAATSPHSPSVRMLRAELEAGRGNYAAAEAEIEQSRREQQASLSWTAQASWALARLDVRGKLARAAQHGRDYM